jgi:hypothetical protein
MFRKAVLPSTLMKKVLLFFAFWVSACTLSYGQGTMVWENRYPLPKAQVMRTATLSPSKRFWVGLSEFAYCPVSTNTYVRTTEVLAFKDSTGDTLWHQNFVSYYHDSEGWGVVPAPNGNFWATVFFRQGNSSTNRGIGVFLVDSLGQVLEHREFMKGCVAIRCEGVYAQPDGGFVITAGVEKVLSNCTDWDLMAMRVDGSGNLLWQQVYTMPGNQGIISTGLYPNNRLCISYNEDFFDNNRMLYIDLPSGIILEKKSIFIMDNMALITWPLRDGGFIVHGALDTSGTGSGYLPYISRTDANFNVLWSRFDTTGAYARAIETRDSAVIMMGSTKEPTNIAVRYPFMAKVSLLTGQELWRRYLSDSALSATHKLGYKINDIIVTENNELMVVGGAPRLPYVFAQPGDYYMAKYIGVADFLQPSDYCTDSLRANFTGTWLQDTLRLRSTSNSGMAFQDSLDYQWLIGGATVSLDSAVQQNLLAAQHPNGLPVTLVITNFWGCTDTLTAKVMPDGTITGLPVDTHGSVYQSNTHNRAYLRNAYPNPSAQNVSIGYTLPAKTENAVLRVYELGTGRTVAERNLSSNTQETRFDVSTWATGVYAYQLYVNGAPVAVKKMTVSR